MMTNSNFFFINAENYNPESPYGNAPPGTPALKFNPRQAELHFHYDYYAGSNFYPDTGADNSFIRDLNAGYNYGDLGGYNGRFNTEAIKNSTVWDRLSLFHAYCQVTSFDFLDSQIFGLRGDKCSISYTNANKDSSGSNIAHPPEEYPSRNAAHCGIFFGCLFPDGYQGFEDYLVPRTFQVFSNGDGKYVQHNGSNFHSASLPFQDVDSRNNCRQATVGSKNSSFVDPNNLAWSRAKDELSYTLFHNQETLDSVPADVMLNASPSGVNGHPIYPVHRFKFMHKPNFDSIERDHVNYLQEVKNAFNTGQWLYKNDGAIPSLYNSAFDFKPNNPNHVMFRPLKMEAYTQFLGSGQNIIDAAKDTSKQDTSNSFGSRLLFLCEGYRTQFDYTMPVANLAFSRELNNNEQYRRIADSGGFSDYTDGKPYLFSVWGLEWGGELESRPTYRNIHRGSYWGGTRESFNLGFPEGAMKWTRNQSGIKDWTGAGAYGIITTSKTVAAKKAITITTDNRYGMGAQAAGTFSITGGHSQQYRTWGVPSFSNPYRQENIHDLSVRIYQHHPKNQTLFDPRTFAVHHFNPGVEYPLTTDQSNVRKCTNTRVSGEDGSGNAITFTYKQCRPINSVDMQIPSKYVAWPGAKPFWGSGGQHEDEKDYVAVGLLPNTLVYSDSTQYGNDHYPPVINEKFWVFEGIRIGKLLPFRYGRLQIGVPSDIGQVLSFGSGMILASDLTPLIQPETNLVVINQGTNYAVGDIVGSSQYNVDFRVSQVGEQGQVIKLECVNSGKVRASNASKYTDIFDPSSVGPIRIRDTKSGAGGNFSAYYVVARVNLFDTVDPKPRLITPTDPVRVASDIPQARHQTSGPNSSVESLAIVEDTKSTEFLITDDNKSSDNRYDIFFHFHNDITMTWLASNQDFHGDRNNAAEAVEQFISARITVS
jgi:hypothetical protein